MSTNIKIQFDDHSPEVLAALENAIERWGRAAGAAAAAHAKDNLTAQGAVDTGNLRNRISYQVIEE